MVGRERSLERERRRVMAELRGSHGEANGNLLTRDFGTPDLHKIDVYESKGGYTALRKALLEMEPAAITNEVKTSGLRGRGGAGFATGVKWSFIKRDAPEPKYVVINADESEPGTAKDRYILENSPHMVLEGIMIAAYAVGANQAWIYIRGEYDEPHRMLMEAIGEAHDKGYLGPKPMGKDFPLDIRVYRGHGAYICGEETADAAQQRGDARHGAGDHQHGGRRVRQARDRQVARHSPADRERQREEARRVRGRARRDLQARDHGTGRRTAGQPQGQGVLARRIVCAGAARVDARHHHRHGGARGREVDGRLGRRDRDGRLALRRPRRVPAPAVLRARVLRQVHAVPRRRRLGGAHVRAHPGQ